MTSVTRAQRKGSVSGVCRHRPKNPNKASCLVLIAGTLRFRNTPAGIIYIPPKYGQFISPPSQGQLGHAHFVQLRAAGTFGNGLRAGQLGHASFRLHYRVAEIQASGHHKGNWLTLISPNCEPPGP